MTHTPVLLILGAGKNIGLQVAKTFRSNGYKVAVTARSASSDFSGVSDLSIQADFSKPNSIADVFKEVTSKLGSPNVVLYNAAHAAAAPGDDPLAQDLSVLETSININFVSVYAAAKESINGFKSIPDDVKKTFIYTGNALNQMVIPSLVLLGTGKAASAHMIQSLATAYSTKGYSFYFADERTPEGAPVGNKVDGEAHASEFWNLANDAEQGPWDYTFVKGKGYAKF